MTTMTTNPPQNAARPQTTVQRRNRDLLILGGLFALMIVGLVSLALATGWEETIEQIKKLTLWQLAVLLGFSLINYLFRGLRWHLFAKRLGLPTGISQNIRHFIGGFAMSVTPGRVGELVRMRWIQRETGWSFERTAPLVLIDRASDLVAMALILTLALVLSATGLSGAIPVVPVALIVALVATRPVLLSGIATFMYRLIGKAPRLFVKVRRAAASLAKFSNPWVMGAATILGLIGWLAEGIAFYLLLAWMGADVGIWTAIAIFVFATLVGGLIGSPGGIGGAEGAMIGLLLLEGVPIEVSLPATLIIRITTLWFAIGLGLLVFPWAERKSNRGMNGLENR